MQRREGELVLCYGSRLAGGYAQSGVVGIAVMGLGRRHILYKSIFT